MVVVGAVAVAGESEAGRLPAGDRRLQQHQRRGDVRGPRADDGLLAPGHARPGALAAMLTGSATMLALFATGWVLAWQGFDPMIGPATRFGPTTSSGSSRSSGDWRPRSPRASASAWPRPRRPELVSRFFDAEPVEPEAIARFFPRGRPEIDFCYLLLVVRASRLPAFNLVVRASSPAGPCDTSLQLLASSAELDRGRICVHGG